MLPGKADIVAHLKGVIDTMQGFQRFHADGKKINLGPLNHAFPGKQFPLAATHEFLISTPEQKSATLGFIASVLSSLIHTNGICIWVSSVNPVFPPALKIFGIDPGKIIFVECTHPREKLWVMEEALKCEGVAAVIGEIKELNFTVSRRFQLAVEDSRVTGFIIRDGAVSNNACVSRWKISSLPGSIENDLPGIGFPRWNVELIKIRNGYPGNWEIEWSNGHLHAVMDPVRRLRKEKRKVG
jgi:protein ImuA